MWLHCIPHDLRIITLYIHAAYYAIVKEWHGLSVCLTVCHTSEPCKTAEAIELPFGLRTRVGPRNHVLHGVQIPWEAAILKGKRVNHCKL